MIPELRTYQWGTVIFAQEDVQTIGKGEVLQRLGLEVFWVGHGRSAPL
ncbi:hypothetical protein [Pseudomonas oryziphila]|nr:hypothetical protein [Pseudomonas oryziphila]